MKRKHFLQVLMLLSVTALCTLSCKKQTATAPLTETNRAERLAQAYMQPVGPNAASLKAEYNSLSEAELKIFQQAIYRLNSQIAKPEITETQFLALNEENNKASKARFGVPVNKISDEKLIEILTGNENGRVNQNFVEPPPGGDPVCEFLPYQTYFYWANDPNIAYSPAYNSYRIVDFYRGDCDGYELTYHGYYNKLRALTYYGAQSIAMFLQGDHIYVNGTRTRVLHKKSSVLSRFGSVAVINDHIRMANELIMEE